MRYLPIHLDTKDQLILIIGGSHAAEAKLRTLLKTEAKLHVYAKSLSPEIARWHEQGLLSWVNREVEDADILKARLVYVATEDADENSRLSALARELGVFVNVADQKQDCDFFSPAIVDRSPVVISIGTEGTSPGLARAIKTELEQMLPSRTGAIALKIQELRERVSRKLADISARQAFWAAILGKDLKGQLSLSESELEQKVEARLSGQKERTLGHVSLVGAGPGDAGLLTLSARQKLHNADVIVYDRLVSQEVLDFGRREAEYIYVGKVPGGKSTSQPEINKIIVEKARAGLSVGRLKSGDPLIFGRADEEIDVLEAASLSYDIVPGITSAAAAAAEIGVSLTSRGHNKSVAFITGHDAQGFAEHDWSTLAAPGGRAAVYMGVGASRFIQGRLLLHGADKNLPVTIVENASRPEQKVLQSTLGSLAQDIEISGIKGPAILLLGYEARQAISDVLPRLGVAI